MNLAHGVKFHNWDSMETRDLMARLDLIKELRTLPLRELAEILKEVKPEAAAQINLLIGANRNERF